MSSVKTSQMAAEEYVEEQNNDYHPLQKPFYDRIEKSAFLAGVTWAKSHDPDVLAKDKEIDTMAKVLTDAIEEIKMFKSALEYVAKGCRTNHPGCTCVRDVAIIALSGDKE